jgi:hypothetical protein
MYSPRGRTGRTPGRAGPVVAALALALMGMGGVALAAPKTDPGPPEQAQGKGPAPQAQAHGHPPQAGDAAPAPKAKAKGPDGVGGPAEVPPQAGANADPGSPNHGQAPGEVAGRGHTHSKAGRADGCQAARCQGGAPKPSADASGGGEQPQPAGGAHGPAAGDVPGVSERIRERPDDDRVEAPHGESESGDSGVLGSVQGLNQGGDEEAYGERGSFAGVLPFTGFELALLAAMGALLAVAGVLVRRSTA